MRQLIAILLLILLTGCQSGEEINKCTEPTEQDKKNRSFFYEIISNDICFLKNEQNCKIEDKCNPCENSFVDNLDCQCNESGNFWDCKKNRGMDRHIYSIIEEPCIQRKEKECKIFPDPTRTNCMDYDMESKKMFDRKVEFDQFGYHCKCEPRSAIYDSSKSNKIIYYGRSEIEKQKPFNVVVFDTYFCELIEKKEDQKETNNKDKKNYNT